MICLYLIKSWCLVVVEASDEARDTEGPPPVGLGVALLERCDVPAQGRTEEFKRGGEYGEGGNRGR